MIPSMIPGTPTHSKITGALGLTPRRLRGTPDLVPRHGDAPELLHRPDGEVDRRGDGVQMTMVSRRGVG